VRPANLLRMRRKVARKLKGPLVFPHKRRRCGEAFPANHWRRDRPSLRWSYKDHCLFPQILIGCSPSLCRTSQRTTITGLYRMAEAATPAAPLRRGSDIPQKERFFCYFRQEITGWLIESMNEARLTMDVSALEEQMGRLGDTALVGGERTDAIEHLVAGIARLGSEVNDASGYLPAYDQRTYGEVLNPHLFCLAKANC